MTTFQVGSATDVGRLRSNNQDAKLVGRNLYAVADGMGGHQGGEVASALAVETLRSAIAAPTTPAFLEAVRVANRTIYERSAADPDLRGMGTTLCGIALVETESGGEQLAIVNVGDSRAYLFRGNDLMQLTRDHSLVEDLRIEGRLTAEQAAVHPHRNILTRALGIDPEVEVDHHEVDPVVGDRYLLCSDGLFNEVTVERIAATLRRLDDPQEAALELVRLANDHGGRDNITVVLVDVVDDGSTTKGASVLPAADPAPSTAVAPEHDVAGFSTAPAADQAAPNPSAAVAEPEVAEPEGEAGSAAPERPAGPQPVARSRRFTWRVWLFVLVVLTVFAAAAGAVTWYARHTYYVGVEQGQVTIYKGRPGGVLWFHPTVTEHTGILVEAMPAQYRDDLNKGVEEPSLSSARGYIAKLQGIAAAQGTTPPSSTTTPTTATPTTSVP